MDGIEKFIILLLFILVPVISAIAKGAKSYFEKLKREQERRVKKGGAVAKTPARELAEFVKPQRAPVIDKKHKPAEKKVPAKGFLADIQEILGIPETATGEQPLKIQARPRETAPPAAAVLEPSKPEETLEEHLYEAWGKNVQPTGVEGEAARFQSVLEDQAADVEKQMRWDKEPGKGKPKQVKARRKGISFERLSKNDLARGVILAEILAPPLALREPGEGPLPLPGSPPDGGPGRDPGGAP